MGKRSGNGLNILLKKSTEDSLKASPFSNALSESYPTAFVCVSVYALSEFTLSPKRQKKANSNFP